MKRSDDNRIGFWRICAGLALAAGMFQFAMEQSEPPMTNGKESPQDLVNALHSDFRKHHDRAVHTKGVMAEGTSAPSKDAPAYIVAPIFADGTLNDGSSFDFASDQNFIVATSDEFAPTAASGADPMPAR